VPTVSDEIRLTLNLYGAIDAWGDVLAVDVERVKKPKLPKKKFLKKALRNKVRR